MARIYLDTVEPNPGDDMIIAAAKPGFPLLKGAETTHLACGHCREVLAWNISAASIRKSFVVGHRLLFECRCGAFNLVPD